MTRFSFPPISRATAARTGSDRAHWDRSREAHGHGFASPLCDVGECLVQANPWLARYIPRGTTVVPAIKTKPRVLFEGEHVSLPFHSISGKDRGHKGEKPRSGFNRGLRSTTGDAQQPVPARPVRPQAGVAAVVGAAIRAPHPCRRLRKGAARRAHGPRLRQGRVRSV